MKTAPHLKPPAAPDTDAVRERILQSASEHFFTHGFSTITMDDLASALGMSKKTLYVHFPSKEQLLQGVIRRKAGQIRQKLEGIAGQSRLPYREKLRAAMTALVGELSVIQPVFIYNLRKYAPAQFQEVDQIRRHNFAQVFGRLLEEGRRQGHIRPELEIPLAIELMLGAFRSMLEGDALNRLQLTPARAIQLSLDLMFDGLLKRNH